MPIFYVNEDEKLEKNTGKIRVNLYSFLKLCTPFSS